MTDESRDAYAVNGSYTGSNYGIFTYANIEDGVVITPEAWKEDTYTAINGYFPEGEGLPSISVGYEIGDDASETDLDEITSFFVGLQWDDALVQVHLV